MQNLEIVIHYETIQFCIQTKQEDTTMKSPLNVSMKMGIL
jgi:hypothetical protein